MKVITFVTENIQKMEEVSQILQSDDIQVNMRSMELDELQGEIRDICKRKCEDAQKVVDGPVLIDDTCLCFKALNGFPGPYVKHLLKAGGVESLYKILSAYEDKSATAICTFAYFDPKEDQQVNLFVGEVKGKIVEPRGDSGFGWDSVFQPLGHDKTYAQMSREEKNSVSHRRRALDRLKDYLHDTDGMDSFPAETNFNGEDITVVINEEEKGVGKIRITNEGVTWRAVASNFGFAIDYNKMVYFGTSRDAERFPRPCIFMMVSALNDRTDPNTDQEMPLMSDRHAEEAGDGNDDEEKSFEVLIIPNDIALLEQMYEAIKECSSRCTDPELVSADGNDGDFEGDDEGYDGENGYHGQNGFGHGMVNGSQFEHGQFEDAD